MGHELLESISVPPAEFPQVCMGRQKDELECHPGPEMLPQFKEQQIGNFYKDLLLLQEEEAGRELQPQGEDSSGSRLRRPREWATIATKGCRSLSAARR
jgi:hypothetical protein